MAGESPKESGRLWSSRARDWACLQEPLARPAYEVVFERLDLAAGMRVLDVGCGAGLALQMAAARGALVSGIDPAEGLLAIAGERVPEAELRVGDMTALPWPAHLFERVVGFNSFQFAPNPVAALREAKRVTKPGGRVGVVVWGRDDECEAVVQRRALDALMHAEANRSSRPSDSRRSIAEVARAAGLTIRTDESIDWPWRYPDLPSALKGLMSAGGVSPVIDHAGEEAVESALAACLARFGQPDGSYLLRNRLRAVTAAA